MKKILICLGILTAATTVVCLPACASSETDKQRSPDTQFEFPIPEPSPLPEPPRMPHIRPHTPKRENPPRRIPYSNADGESESPRTIPYP